MQYRTYNSLCCCQAYVWNSRRELFMLLSITWLSCLHYCYTLILCEYQTVVFTRRPRQYLNVLFLCLIDTGGSTVSLFVKDRSFLKIYSGFALLKLNNNMKLFGRLLNPNDDLPEKISHKTETFTNFMHEKNIQRRINHLLSQISKVFLCKITHNWEIKFAI